MTDLHVHTTYSDGKNTPEEVVLSAIEKGIKTLGFSDHSFTEKDADYCMAPHLIADYVKEISALKEKYANKIKILCGIEQDFYSETPTDMFDYVIGSVHLVKKDDRFFSVDHSLDVLKQTVEKYFGGDFYLFAESYFDTVSKVVEKTNADIIGHFDLISKFCEIENLFDSQNPRYQNAWKKAVDNLLKYDIPFEVNTGAISRGYRKTPYPTAPIYDYIKQKGGKFILSSDSHSAETLAFKFREFSHLAD